jgi:hypothetical protein
LFGFAFGALIVAFIIFITVKGDLSKWIQLLLYIPPQSASGGSQSASSSGSPSASGTGSSAGGSTAPGGTAGTIPGPFGAIQNTPANQWLDRFFGLPTQ